MTTIRRIVTSKIDGNGANSTNDSEIRPFGETAFYVDDNGPTDKLVLAIHDGVRTHIKSKVLGPGILFGSNADAGDGSGSDTIKLIPDATLFDQGSNQYIVVDPTGGEPGHIHLRAGGTQDASTADLYLGGELTNVRVSDTSGNVRIRTTNIGDPNITLDWTFDNSGDLTFPGSSNARIGESEPGLVVRSGYGFAVVTNADPVSNYEVEFIGYIHNGFNDGPGATLTVTEIVAGTITDGMTIYGAGLPPEGWTVTIGGGVPNPGSGGTGNYLLAGANFFTSSQSFNNNVLAAGSKSWVFGPDGNLTLSNGGTIRVDENNVEIGSMANFNVEAAGVVNIYTDTEGETPYQWQFGDDGKLNLPPHVIDEMEPENNIYTGIKFGDDTVQTTAFKLNEYGDFYTGNFLASGAGLTGYGGGVFIRTSRPDAEATVDFFFNENGQLEFPNNAVIRVDESNLEIGGMANFNVEASGVVNIYTDTEGETPYQWQFGDDGVLTLPGEGVIRSNNDTIILKSYDTEFNSSKGIRIGTNGSVYFELGDDPAYFQIEEDNDNSTLTARNNLNIVSSGSDSPKTWTFGTDGNLTLPSNGYLVVTSGLATTGASPAPTISGFSITNSVGISGEGNISGGDITATGNVSATSFIGDGSQLTGLPASYSDSDVVTLLSSFGSNTITTTGNITAGNFVGNITITGNVTGTSANVELVAGSYTWTFDNTGTMTAPAVGGDEGGEINFGIPATNTTLVDRVKFDVYQDRIRFFDGSAKGAYIDLSQAGAGVGTLLNNRVAALVNAGTFVTMDNIKATVTSSGNRGLSLASVSGTFNINIGGTYGMTGSGAGSQAGTLTITTTASSSVFGWGFFNQGDTSTYIITDTTNSRAYRITLQIGNGYNNNMISIERLI